jgi:Protein of unknown function (DUF2478)
VTFDAQCDLAAVVYRTDDDPDRVLIDFAADLCSRGLRPVGVVQIGRHCRSENPPLGVIMLPGGDTVRLAQTAGARAAGCQLDATQLNGVAVRVARDLANGADILIINRFGQSEAEGVGLTSLIGRALESDIPVLIAVPERRFHTLIRFADGMNVRLPCRLEALDRWWQSVARSATWQSRDRFHTFCEIMR